MIGLPKNAESMAIVAIVKLCSPLSHLVISLGRRPSASANCFLESPRSHIRSTTNKKPLLKKISIKIFLLSKVVLLREARRSGGIFAGKFVNCKGVTYRLRVADAGRRDERRRLRMLPAPRYEHLSYDLFFASLRRLVRYATGAAINIVASVPITTPNIMANVNERIASPPRMKIHRSTNRVDAEVITVRPRVELSEELMVVKKSCLG